MEDADRLSKLSDEILCRILSFLPTPISVSTSILAKRWRFLFDHVPDLYFDYDWEYYSQKKKQKKQDIITRAVILHKSQTINTLRLSLGFVVSEFVLEMWIKAAMSLNVKNFDLHIPHQKLPPCLFTCKTLVTLSLGGYSVSIPSLDTVSLPSLKKLHLYSAHCQLDKTIPHLLSGCPVIEELIIETTFVVHPELRCWNISSTTIQKLTVNEREHQDLEIYAPALRYFKFDYNCCHKHISICPLTSLVEADICLNKDMVEEADAFFVYDLINPLCNVKHLKLSCANIAVENTESSEPFLKFDSLTKLDVYADWCFFIKFLRCADNLQDLIIRKFYGGTGKYAKIWRELFGRWPACMHSLTTVTFANFGCEKQEFKMASYFLRNAKVLKRVDIHIHLYSVSAETKSNAIKRISSFEQGSKACKVVFH